MVAPVVGDLGDANARVAAVGCLCEAVAATRYAWLCWSCSDDVVTRHVVSASKSATYPTRLETRTKESNMCASHWVVKPKGAMKVKVDLLS